VDIEERVPNINKTKEVLGYSPKVGLEEGLKKTMDWYKKHKDHTTINNHHNA